jgi:hypothetical protein
MKLYVTGSGRQEELDLLCTQLRDRGHTTTTPFDVVDNDYTEAQNLINRCQEVLRNDMVVTTNPLAGEWLPGAEREVRVARAAEIPVTPGMKLLDN